MLASSPVVKSSSRLGLLRRSPAFGYLFLATAGSSFGTYLAAVALTLQVYDATESGVWVAALLIADFLPIVVIGFLLGPLVDRLSRRRLMIASDLVRFGVFAALPFVDGVGGLIALAAVSGIATGFFLPAANAAIPNLVPEEELVNANSLVVTVETLSWMIGPVVAGLLVTAWGTTVPYAVNAVTFLLSAALVARIPGGSASFRGLAHARSLARRRGRSSARLHRASRYGPFSSSGTSRSIGSAAVNVAEVVFAKDTLDAGDVGFGALVAASGVGLAFGSFLSAPALGKVGLRRTYVSSLAADGSRVGGGGAQRLDLARRRVRDRRRRGERLGHRLQPAPRPARRTGSVPGSCARDDHELELRRARPRDGRRRRPDGCVRRACRLDRRRRRLPRRVGRRARAHPVAPGRGRGGAGRVRGELRVGGRRARERNGYGQEHVPVDDGKPESGLERIATLLEEIEARRRAESTGKTELR